MELVAAIRSLWHRRILVGFGALLAVAAGLLASHAVSSGREATAAVASAQVLLDTADSQLVNAAPVAAATLPMRAVLLSDLMASDAGRAMVVRNARLPADQLVVLGPSTRLESSVPTPLAQQAAAVAGDSGFPFVLHVDADEESPLISIEAHAPDVRRAKTLAGAAVRSLTSWLAADDADQTHGFVIETIAAPHAEQPARPSRRLPSALVGAFVAVGLWCAFIAVFAGIAQRARRVGSAPQPA